MIATGLLLGLAAIVFSRFVDGTLPAWLGAKFLNRAEPNRPQLLAPVDRGPRDAGEETGTLKGVSLRRPLPGATISPFGADRDGGARKHQGIDIAASYGDRIAAAGAGRVSRAGSSGNLCGNRVTIDHGQGVETIYCHLDEVRVRTGERVAQLIPIGTVGDTGNAVGTAPHLHFEVHVGGRAIDPDSVIG